MSNTHSQPPVFILGSPRSGTTFAVTLLNRHSELFGFNETLFYEYVQSGQQQHIQTRQEKDDIGKHLLDRLQVRTNSENKGFGCTIDETTSEKIATRFREALDATEIPLPAVKIFQQFMQICAETCGKRRWVEKTPNHVFYVAEILRDFPDAKFIHISRNPYSYLISYKYSPYTVNNVTRRGKLYHPLVTSILWNNAEKSIDHARSLIDSQQLHSVCESLSKFLHQDTIG